MTVQPDAGQPPDKKLTERVRVVLDHPQEGRRSEPLFVASLPSRSPRAGRHRRPPRDGWLCLAAQVLARWSTTLRACVLLTAFGAIVVAVVLTTAPAIGLSVGTIVSGLGLLAFWTAQTRRMPQPRL